MRDKIDEKKMNKLRELITNYHTKITFTKVDGSTRDMVCTLNPNDIPEEHKPKSQKIDYHPYVLRVYDLESKGWRAFRYDSVKCVRVRKAYWSDRTNKVA